MFSRRAPSLLLSLGRGVTRNWSPVLAAARRCIRTSVADVVQDKALGEPRVEDKGAAARRPSMTPMMNQYFETKARHPGYLLLFRMGDFYEMFFEDAIRASQACDITLTARGKHLGAEIPMAGFPHHALDIYLERFVKKGIVCAICDQVEDPVEARKRKTDKLVRREVTRLVTPGTIIEERFLQPREHNYLVSVARSPGSAALGLAWLDLSTGEFSMASSSVSSLATDLARLTPSEIVVAEDVHEAPELATLLQDYHVSVQRPAAFDAASAAKRLCGHFGVANVTELGSFSQLELGASGALLGHVSDTQQGRQPRLSRPTLFSVGATMQIDPATRRSLELTRTNTGEREGSLLALVDQTVTGPGGRLLASRLNAPLTSSAEISRRLDVVQLFVENTALTKDLRELLRHCADIARCLQRLSLGRGGPVDLKALGTTLREVGALRNTLADVMPAARKVGGACPEWLSTMRARLGTHKAIVDELERALVAEPPQQVKEGGFIAEGYSKALDHLNKLRREGDNMLLEMQQRFQKETGVATLRIRSNNLQGYYVQIPSAQRAKMPASFILRQSLTGVSRYSCEELSKLDAELSTAQNEGLRVELELFQKLSQMVVKEARIIAEAADAMAELDVCCGLATLATNFNYTRPQIDDSRDFVVEGGRHAVVEAHQLKTSSAFVANDCRLATGQTLWLITGPNMGGKSTFLRQNAIIAVMAQIGSFVPAQSARLGVVDKLFCRVGASDDLRHDRSTFKVEMDETAQILQLATPKSMVIMDEIGRGTGTYDGLAIAWACVEHLVHSNASRSLFATHYHELTALQQMLPNVANFAMMLRETSEGSIVFLYRVVAGGAGRSYGIQVARIAGLPSSVIARATELLKKFETDGASRKSAAPQEIPPALVASLRVMEPDSMAPREALAALYKLKALLPPKGA